MTRNVPRFQKLDAPRRLRARHSLGAPPPRAILFALPRPPAAGIANSAGALGGWRPNDGSSCRTACACPLPPPRAAGTAAADAQSIARRRSPHAADIRHEGWTSGARRAVRRSARRASLTRGYRSSCSMFTRTLHWWSHSSIDPICRRRSRYWEPIQPSLGHRCW